MFPLALALSTERNNSHVCDDELDIQCESLLTTCDCVISHLDDSVSGSQVGVNSLLEKRHGASRTETGGYKEHAGAALRGANDIAAGSDQGIGLYEHIKF